jgi:hypothetical protein
MLNLSNAMLKATLNYIIRLIDVKHINKITQGKFKTNLNVKKHQVTTNYTKLILDLKNGISFNEIKALEDNLKDEFCAEIEVIQENYGEIIIYIYDEIKEKLYKPVKLKPNEILVGYNVNGNIIIDMNKFCHLLINGIVGSGKSYLLHQIIKNLIFNNNAKVFLYQIIKNDLSIYKDQIPYFNTFETINNSLDNIAKEIIRRTELMDMYNITNIVDYNKKCFSKLDYIYLIFDEFSYITSNKILIDKVMNITKVGRAIGINCIFVVQSPRETECPPRIKSICNNIISFKTANEDNSKLILDINEACHLKQQQAILKNFDYTKFNTFTIEL